MGAPRSRRRGEVGTGALTPTSADPAGQGRLDIDEPAVPPTPHQVSDATRPDGRVVRVIPDVTAIDKEFDYVVPAAWEADGRAERVVVGAMVKIPLAGRRVDGWVSAVDVEPAEGVKVAPLRKLRGVGPGPDLIDLAGWAAWRWAGRRIPFLRAASPPRMVAGVADRPVREVVPTGPADVFAQAVEQAGERGLTVVRTPPADDGRSLALAACRLGDTLIITADASRARHLAIALRRAGVTVALGTDDWAIAAAGATVVGTRSAAWLPMPELAAVVVLDEHDESLQEERTPTWHARDVAVERGKRAGAPVVLASPSPSLEALRAGPLLRLERAAEREAWPVAHVLDRRDEDPVRAGLFNERLVDHVRGDGRVVCVLNRKGRARLLACNACGELVRTTDGRAPMVMDDRTLRSLDGAETRPAVCGNCGATALKNLRAGVTRAREELAALVGEPVDEVTASTERPPTSRVVIGTEAVLHRVDRADAVVFLDLDQELLAPRQRAAEQAMALMVRAARLLGPRVDDGRLVVQTRQPEHEVVQAVVRGDPSLVAVAERDRRQALGLPPYGAQVVVSGAGAAAFVEAFGSPPGVKVLGPADDRWLLRAETHEPILEALAVTARPAARVRVEVDPLRV